MSCTEFTHKIFKLKVEDRSSPAFVATFMYEWRKLDMFQFGLDKYFAKIAMVVVFDIYRDHDELWKDCQPSG